MEYIYLLLAMTTSATITIGGRLYNEKNKDRTNISLLYNVLSSCANAFIWLVLWIFDFSFDARVLPYCALLGIFVVLFNMGMIGALKYGSTSITALVKQMALVGISVWGFVFWDVQLTWLTGIGIVLIVIALAFCLLNKKAGPQVGNFWKWVFFAVLIAVGNAGVGIVVRYQQMAFDYQHKNMFMFFGVLCGAVFCALLALREDKKHWKAAIRSSWMFSTLAGSSSALSNVFILLMIQRQMSPSILYPGIAVGGLMITTIISLLCFKERLRPLQWVGLAVGAVALVLLNL